MQSDGLGESTADWLVDEAARRLQPLGSRWLHVQGVAATSVQVAAILPRSERSWLGAAAYLHDIGWDPHLCDPGFHPIDGARWLRGMGLNRLACLVPFHSGAS